MNTHNWFQQPKPFETIERKNNTQESHSHHLLDIFGRTISNNDPFEDIRAFEIRLGPIFDRPLNLAWNTPEHDLHDLIQQILETSFNSYENKRDDTIELDVQTSICQENECVCSVCQDTLQINSEMVKLECNHSFHPNCIKEWGKYKQECPNCRHQINFF